MPKISELASGAPVVSTDALVIQRGGANYSVTIDNLQALYPQKSEDAAISGAWEFRNAGGVGILSEIVPDTYESSLWLQCTENYSAGRSLGSVSLYINKNGVAGGWVYMGIYQQDGGATGHLAATDAPYLYLGRFAGEFAYEAGNPKLNVGDVIGEITWDTKNESSDGAIRVYKLSVVYDGAGTGTVGGAYLEHRNHLGITWRYETDGGLVGYASSMESTGGSKGAGTINCKGLYVDGVPANLAPTVVASLPAAATAGAGARGFATDATATTFHSIVAGGGANFVPVFSDGTNWRIG